MMMVVTVQLGTVRACSPNRCRVPLTESFAATELHKVQIANKLI